jgi:hypothetical protein
MTRRRSTLQAAGCRILRCRWPLLSRFLHALLRVGSPRVNANRVCVCSCSCDAARLRERAENVFVASWESDQNWVGWAVVWAMGLWAIRVVVKRSLLKIFGIHVNTGEYPAPPMPDGDLKMRSRQPWGSTASCGLEKEGMLGGHHHLLVVLRRQGLPVLH